MELQRLGKYQIVGKIGQGAMGEVYKAHDPILNRDVAIKTMSAAIGADEDLRKRFHREAQSAARLNHPNIITVYDFGEEQGKIYMAMELLEGTDLKDLIGRHTPMSLEQKLGLMEQICDGLAFAHVKEVVHRDLKPANLHIQPNGQIKIMDFGLAKLSSSDMTRAGMIMGTPNYMSPEQVRGEKADSRSDVFSLGAVFYELLANRKPFDADSLHAVLFQVMQSEPEPLPNLVPDLPPSLAHLIEKAMAKDPSQRFRDAREMRDALRPVRGQLGSAWTMVPADTESLVDATMVGAPATLAGAPPPAENRPASDSRPPSDTRPPSDSRPPAPRRVIVNPPTPIPRAPSPPPAQVEGAVALEPQARRMPDTVAPRMPTTLSGHAKTVAGPGARPAAEATTYTPPPPMPPPLESRPHTDTRPPMDMPRPAARAETEATAAWKVPVFVGGGALVVAILSGGIYLVTRPDVEAPKKEEPTAPTPGPGGPDVDALTRQLLASQVELAKKHLEDKNFRQALQQAEQVLQKDPQNAAAKAVVDQSQGLLKEVNESVAQIKTALDAGDTRAASAALTRVMALDPQNPAAAEFSTRLNGVFKGQAESARGDMKTAQQEAQRARAVGQADYGAASTLAGDAELAFKNGQFTEAARKFLAARDAFGRARRAAERAERTTPPPSLAISMPPAPTIAPPSVTAAPQPPAPTLPLVSADETAVRRMVAEYKRAVENHDDALYSALKPNASGAEKRAIKQNVAQEVEMRVADVRVEGDSATVMVSRKDVNKDRQVTRMQQTLIFQKKGDGWTIRSITSALIQ